MSSLDLFIYIIIFVINFVAINQYKIPKHSISDVKTFIQNIHRNTIKSRTIIAYSAKEWKYVMHPSLSLYLFEDFRVVENIAPEGNINRPGDKHKKEYICVHDTGDWAFNAFQWSEIVRRAAFDDGSSYNSSFQYVVGNDGIYHNIPDDETAFHAGDGHTIESVFEEYPSGIYAKSTYPGLDSIYKSINSNILSIGISKDGYYTINSEKSLIVAPRNSTDYSILKTKDINDMGIFVRLNKLDNQYYIGKTWYSDTYNKIANRGGNFNSIGIESCINTNSDIYLTWQKLAKLVAHLMHENNLDISRVKQHHFFSGKNCPQTIRTIKYWDYFINLVKVEFRMLEFIKEGFNFKFESLNKEYLDDNGRVKKTPESGSVKVQYKVTIGYEGNEEKIVFDSVIPAYKGNIEEENK